MKKIIAIVLAALACLSFASCGGPDRQPAIDAFNSAKDGFNEVATYINEDIESYDEEVVEVMNEMADTLEQHKELLEGDDELSQEKLDEMIAWYGEVETWVANVKAELGME